MRAANGQRDSSTVVINVQKTFQVPIPAGSTSGAIAINLWRSLLDSNIFSAYNGMYDQVKISGISAKIRGLNGSSAITLSNTPTICTAWDRNGLESASPNALPTIDYNTVSSYSSAVISNWSPGNAFRITRRLYPSTMAEKSYYASCGSLNFVSNSGSSVAENQVLIRNPASSYVYITGQEFKPILLIGAYCGFTTTVEQSIGLMIEFDITTKFRGLRKFTTAVDDTTQQIANMAGTFLDGASGTVLSANLTGNWTRVNNDGVIQGTGAPTDPEEIGTRPPVKVENS